MRVRELPRPAARAGKPASRPSMSGNQNFCRKRASFISHVPRPSAVASRQDSPESARCKTRAHGRAVVACPRRLPSKRRCEATQGQRGRPQEFSAGHASSGNMPVGPHLDVCAGRPAKVKKRMLALYAQVDGRCGCSASRSAAQAAYFCIGDIRCTKIHRCASLRLCAGVCAGCTDRAERRQTCARVAQGHQQ